MANFKGATEVSSLGVVFDDIESGVWFAAQLANSPREKARK
jgi:hypothetical protein